MLLDSHLDQFANISTFPLAHILIPTWYISHIDKFLKTVREDNSCRRSYDSVSRMDFMMCQIKVLLLMR